MTTGGVFFVANLEHPPFTDFFLSEATPPSSLTFRRIVCLLSSTIGAGVRQASSDDWRWKQRAKLQ
jgi:hypothetical protein